MNSRWLGLDIGGANLKAWCNGKAISWPFELWKTPGDLAAKLISLTSEFAGFSGVSVTMTGELCDCFASRKEGVSQIVDAVQRAFSEKQILVYQTGGEFVNPAIARESWRKTAAANWHAIASVAPQFLPGRTGVLIDIGSTTTDVIPFLNGQVTARGKTDLARLRHGELLYTGVQRSPVCAVTNRIELAGQKVSLAQEWFASMQDVYIVLEIGAAPDVLETGLDGRPVDFEHSLVRLARLVCSDVKELGREAIVDMAKQVAGIHQASIQASIQNVRNNNPESAGQILVAGQGEWLAINMARRLVSGGGFVARLSDCVDAGTSRCAAAWAVSCLAEKRCGASA